MDGEQYTVRTVVKDRGLMDCPQPFQWVDDYGREWRGVMTWAEGDELAIYRRRPGPKGSSVFVREYLMATSYTRKLTWVSEDRLQAVPFRND